MKRFFVRRWFLLALGAVLFVGFAYWAPLTPAVDRLPRNWVVALVMFTMAFPLDASSMWGALRNLKATTLAVALNFALAPLLAWLLSGMLTPQLGFGLLIAGAVPSTVASAAVWTRRAGGNDAISLMVTTITNLSCFLFTPAMLLLTAGQGLESTSLDATAMMIRLAKIVVLPIAVAQLLRLHRPLGRWATRQKIPLGVVCQLGMLTMVFAGAVRSGKALSGVHDPVAPVDWALMLGAVLSVHLATLAAGHVVGGALRLGRPERIAAAFSGSQKTLLVGLDVAAEYVGVFGGLSLLPIVVYHVSQLLVDTFIADRLRARGLRAVDEEDEALTVS